MLTTTSGDWSIGPSPPAALRCSRIEPASCRAQFLDPQRDGNGFDFVEDFAAKIPAMLIGALLGVPKQDQDQLRIWGDLLMRYEPNGLSEEKANAITSLNSLYGGSG